jgi:hypothetical protein
VPNLAERTGGEEGDDFAVFAAPLRPPRFKLSADRRKNVNTLAAKDAKTSAKFAKGPSLLLGLLLRHTQDLPLAGLLDESNHPQIGRIGSGIELEVDVLRK